MNLLIRHRTQAGFAVVVALLLVAGWWSKERHSQAVRAEQLASQLLRASEGTLIALLRAETANSDFAISGNELYLNPLTDGEAKATEWLAEAQRLTLTHPEPHRRLAALQPLVREKVAFFHETIRLRRSGDTTSTLLHLATGQGARMITDIRQGLEEVSADAGRMQQQHAAQAMAYLMVEIVALGAALALVLVGGAGWLARRNFAKYQQQAETENAQIFKFARDLLCVASTSGYFKSVNPAFTDTLGWSEVDLLSRPFLDFVHPDDREATMHEVEQLATGQPTLHFENRYQCKDGTWRWLAWTAVPRPGGFLFATAHDVTAQHLSACLLQFQAEVGMVLAATHQLRPPLQKCAELLVLTFDAAFARIWTLNDAEQVLELQASAGRYTHLDGPHGRVPVGKFKIGLIAQERKPYLSNQVVGDPRVGDQEWARREGLVAFAGYPLITDGRLQGVMAMFARHPLGEEAMQAMASVANGLALSIEGHRQHEALQRSEEDLAIILRSISDAVLTTDAQRRITRMNLIAEKLTGWTEAEALGRPIDAVFRIISEETREPADIPVDDELATGEIHGLANHTVLLARDGREIAIADSAAPIRDQAGRITGVVLCFHDETMERRARREAAQRAAQTIAHQNALLVLRDHEGEALPAFQRLTTALIAETLHLERVSVWHFDPAQKALECQDLFIRTTLKHERGMRLAAADYPAYFKAIGNHNSVQADDAYTHPATREFTTGYLDSLGVTSMLDVPIRVGGRLAGVLCCEHTGPARQWTAEENKFAITAASYVMLALECADRRMAEAALRDSEERHRLLIHGSSDAMMTHDPVTWRFNSCNPAALALFGVATESEFCQLGPWDVSPEQQPDGCLSAATAQARIAQAMAEGSNFFEWTLKRRDNGREFPVTVLLSRLTQDGKSFLQATVRDNSAQKRAAVMLHDQQAALEILVAERTAALAASERFNTTTLNALSANVAVLDAAGVIIATNSAWRDFAIANGAAWQRVSEGVNYLGVCAAATGEHAAEAQRAAAGIREVISGSRVEFTLEYPCHRAGEQRWFFCRVTRFPGEGPTRVVLTHENISAIKQAQQRAEQMQKQFKVLFEFAPDAMLMTDASGLITLANQQAERLFGYARDELVGQPVELLMPENTRRSHVALREGYFATPLRRTMGADRSLKGRKKDGTAFPVDISLSPLQSSDGQAVVAAVRDITERMLAEKKERHSQRLQAIGTLASGVAHDINNALAPILMSVELLKMTFPDKTQMLDILQVSAGRAADMVRQLLSFTNGSEGARVSVQTTHLLKELQNIMQSTFPKNIKVEVKYAKNLPTVTGDATQLHQVLLNLCVNARDAMPSGGNLVVESESCVVDELYANSIPDAKPGNYLVLRVTDTGTGIPPVIIDRIFDPFFTTKSPDKGTGLGLSTVYGIVKGHGGFLRVYSKPKEGATFTVYLPTDKVTAHLQEAGEARQKFTGHGENILVVDDEPSILAVLQVVLQRLNFTPIIGKDGADGLMQLASHREALFAIIVDMHMPNMDGVSFVRAIRGLMPEIPILAMSGRFDETIVAELANLKVKSLLPKPFTEPELAAAMQKLIAPNT